VPNRLVVHAFTAQAAIETVVALIRGVVIREARRCAQGYEGQDEAGLKPTAPWQPLRGKLLRN
jgi:hypothetical protein